jgi:hypothetical protein
MTKEEYLKEWGWQSEPYNTEFDVWTHKRFPGSKYKLNRAFDKMKEVEEKSSTPVLIVQHDDPSAKEKVQDFLWKAGILKPTRSQLMERLDKAVTESASSQ